MLLVGGERRIFVLDTDEAAPKGNEYSVRIEESVWADMCELRGDSAGDYIVPGANRKERDAVFEKNVSWLRGLGLNVNKPNHELRAIFAQAMGRAHGKQAASDALGHGITIAERSAPNHKRSVENQPSNYATC